MSIEKIIVSGARGENFADTARRTGAYGALPGDSDSQVTDALAEYLVANIPAFAAADAAADAAEASAVQAVQARDIAQAAVGVDYADAAEALAGSSDGDRFTYWDGDDIVFAENDGGVIVPLVGPWFSDDKLAELAVADMLAVSRPARGPGTIWRAGGYRYLELDPSTPIVQKTSLVEVLDGYHVQTAGGVKLRVLPVDGALHSRAFGIEPSSNNTAALQLFLQAATGMKAVINYAATPYLANVLSLWSGTHLTLGRGVRVIGRNNGSAGVFRAFGQENIVLSGYGAYVELPSADVSHALNFTSCKRVVIEGLEIKGPGLPDIHESDCIYLGGDPNTNNVCEGVTLRDVKAYHARRNILSVVGCHGLLAEGCDFSGTITGGTLMTVVDLEGNAWLANGDFPVKNVTFRKCKIHDSAANGLTSDFAGSVVIDDCEIYDNTNFGVQIKTPTHAWTATKNPRDGDRLGVISIDSATGWITVSTSAKLTDDYGIRPGMWFYRAIKSGTGASWPTEISSSGYIEEISADQLSVRVSVTNYGYAVITSTTGSGSAGSGVFDEDPYVSALSLQVARWGEDAVVRNSRCWGNGNDSLRFTGACIIAEGNYITAVAGKPGIGVVQSRSIKLSDNLIDGAGVGTNGIFVQRCSDLRTSQNTVRGFTGAGILLEGASEARLDNDAIRDCGVDSSIKAHVHVALSRRVVVSGTVMSGSADFPTTYGVYFAGTTENCLAIGVSAFGVGTSNANSVSVTGGTNNKVALSILRDGAWSA